MKKTIIFQKKKKSVISPRAKILHFSNLFKGQVPFKILYGAIAVKVLMNGCVKAIMYTQ